MRFVQLAAAAAVCAVIAGCAAPGQRSRPVYNISAEFKPSEAAAALAPGSNTIKGNAFMRQRGGGVVTCAGQDVRLIPVNGYSSQRISALYGNATGGSNSGVDWEFVPNPPEYTTLVAMAKCDAQGNFVFERVADGAFFAVVQITWHAGQSMQGGNLMQLYEVKGGNTIAKVLAP